MRTFLLLPFLALTGCYATSANGGLGVDCSQGGSANAFALLTQSGTATRERYSEGWYAEMRGSVLEVASAPGDFFSVIFEAGDGAQLTVGDYENVDPSEEGGPGFGVAHNGWGAPAGATSLQFTVYEIEFDGSEIRRFRASFWVNDFYGESSGCVRYSAH